MDTAKDFYLEMDNALKSTDVGKQLRAIFQIPSDDQVLVNKVSDYFLKRSHIFQYTCLEKGLPINTLVRALDSTDAICKAIAARFECNDLEFKYKILSNIEQECTELELSSYYYAIKRMSKQKEIDDDYLRAVKIVVIKNRIAELYPVLEEIRDIDDAIQTRSELLALFESETRRSQQKLVLRSATKLSCNTLQSEFQIELLWKLFKSNLFQCEILEHLLVIAKRDSLAFAVHDIMFLFQILINSIPTNDSTLDKVLQSKAAQVLVQVEKLQDIQSIIGKENMQLFLLKLSQSFKHRSVADVDPASVYIILKFILENNLSDESHTSLVIEIIQILKTDPHCLSAMNSLWIILEFFIKSKSSSQADEILDLLCQNAGDSNFPQSFSLYGRHVKFGVYLNEFYSKLDKNQASREKIMLVFRHTLPWYPAQVTRFTIKKLLLRLKPSDYDAALLLLSRGWSDLSLEIVSGQVAFTCSETSYCWVQALKHLSAAFSDIRDPEAVLEELYYCHNLVSTLESNGPPPKFRTDYLDAIITVWGAIVEMSTNDTLGVYNHQIKLGISKLEFLLSNHHYLDKKSEDCIRLSIFQAQLLKNHTEGAIITPSRLSKDPKILDMIQNNLFERLYEKQNLNFYKAVQVIYRVQLVPYFFFMPTIMDIELTFDPKVIPGRVLVVAPGENLKLNITGTIFEHELSRHFVNRAHTIKMDIILNNEISKSYEYPIGNFSIEFETATNELSILKFMCFLVGNESTTMFREETLHFR